MQLERCTTVPWRDARIAFTFALVALVAVPVESPATTLERVRSSGKLRLGYVADARPFSYQDESGNAAGYAVAVCRSVAEQVKVQLGSAALGVEWLNQISTAGAVVTGLSLLVFIANILVSRRSMPKAVANPWGAATLEWAIPSPPPVYNFTVLPEVKSWLPLWTKDGVTKIPDTPPEPIHVPGGSFWPLLSAVAIVIIAIGGLMHSVPVAVGGAVATAVCLWAWAFEPFDV